MDVDVQRLAIVTSARGHVVDPERVPVLVRGLLEELEERGLRNPHRHHLLEPLGLARKDDHDIELRPRAVRHPLEQRITHRARGEVLRLDVDEALGALDRFHVEASDLAHLSTTGDLGDRPREADARGRHRQRHGEVEAGHREGVRRLRFVVHDETTRVEPLARRAVPAPDEQVDHRPCGLAGHRDLDLVIRLMARATRRAVLVVETMRGVVPARLADVLAPEERDAPVDDRHFLVMRAAERHGVVPSEVEARARDGIEVELLEQLAFEREEDAVVPREHADLKLGALSAEPIEEREELRVPRQGPVGEIVAVELPTKQEDALLRFRRGGEERPIVIAAVDQQRALGPIVDPPRGCFREEAHVVIHL